MAIEVLRAGPLDTVQDLGRRGHAALGYAECGAADKYAARLANLLAGNPEGAAVLECTLSGPTLRFDAAALIALTGANMNARLNGEAIPLNMPVAVPEGAELELGPCTGGLRGYLAVHGGIDTIPVLHSRSTDLKCRLGGFEGRPLLAADRLPVGESGSGPVLAATLAERAARIDPVCFSPAVPWGWLGEAGMPVLRAVPGPQDDAFTEAALEAFGRAIYRISPDSNRMAARLQGVRLAAKDGVDIVSDGIVEGSVQVSADGQPIVMLADHQTTGGYAKIATVISCDIPALAQRRPGECVRFRLVRREEGMAALRRERARLDLVRDCLAGEKKGSAI